MSFDGNSDDFKKERWHKEECKTIYNIDEDDITASTLICKCSSLKNHYIGVISDRSRDLEIV